jgi:hypothetical protein
MQILAHVVSYFKAGCPRSEVRLALLEAKSDAKSKFSALTPHGARSSADLSPRSGVGSCMLRENRLDDCMLSSMHEAGTDCRF